MNAWTVTALLSVALFTAGLSFATSWSIAYLILIVGAVAAVGVCGAVAKIQLRKWHAMVETMDSDRSR